jgi:CBS-domain-containing membrane protein
VALQETFMRRFIHRHQPKAHPRTALFAGLGAALAIGGLAFVNDVIGLAMLMAPLGASCVLLFAAPQSPLSQPANVIGGHVLSGVVGLGLHFALPGSFWMAGLAVGAAVAAMVYLRVVHPPAGATALVAYLTAVSWSFLLFPVALGSVALVAVATFYHRLLRTPYPAPLP